MHLECINQRTAIPEVLENRTIRHEAPAETAEELPASEHWKRVQTDAAGLLDQLTEYLAAEILYVVAGVNHTLRYRDGIRELLVVEQSAEYTDSLGMQRVVLPSLGGQQDRLPVGERQEGELDGRSLVTQDP